MSVPLAVTCNWTADRIPSLAGATVIVTGAANSIGLEAAGDEGVG